MHFRISLPLYLLLPLLFPVAAAHGQHAPAPAALSATAIPPSALLQPKQWNNLLASPGGDKAPLVLQVGSHVFYQEAHIRGAKYAGQGSQPAGIALLKDTVAPLPKDRLIVLYCGCCPWNRCPNVGPAFQRLHDEGYTNVKVLYLVNNFGDDWVSKGYATDK